MSIDTTNNSEAIQDIASVPTSERSKNPERLFLAICIALLILSLFAIGMRYQQIASSSFLWIPVVCLAVAPAFIFREWRTSPIRQANLTCEIQIYYPFYLFAVLAAASVLVSLVFNLPILPYLAFALTWLAFAELFLPIFGRGRAILLGILFLMPGIFESEIWRGAQAALTDCIAWEASGMLDGVTVPHLRTGTGIRLVDRTVDISPFSISACGIESLLSIGFLYVFFRKNSLAILSLVLLSLVPIWSGLTSLSALIHIQATSSNGLVWLTPTLWSFVVFSLCLLLILASEIGWSTLFSQIPLETFATEFPLFAIFYNLFSTFPRERTLEDVIHWNQLTIVEEVGDES